MCEETRPRIRRKTDTGDGTTWDKKKSKTKAEMDGFNCKNIFISPLLHPFFISFLMVF